ncbi:MAG: hypothetical protein NTV01_04055, partial [Bacteroidia bacterium]|nr:hypothetical protein [Bacteroidia bacterium]
MKRSIHLLLTALLLVTFSQYSFTQAIHVETEGNGTISKDSGQQNLNGAMVWSGTEWVVNNTWAHTFFVNVETGTRLKNYESPWTCTGTAPTGVVLDFQQYQVTRNIYTYSKPASDNTGAFAYQAVEYLIHNLVSGHNIILRSRGSGNGITQASFDAYIEDDTNPPQTTLFRSDPVWFTFSGTAADAV